jgi:hypothetical protein
LKINKILTKERKELKSKIKTKRMDSKTPTKTINFICMIKPKTIKKKKNFDKRAKEKKKKSNVGGPN